VRTAWWEKLFRMVFGLLLMFGMVLILVQVLEIAKNVGQFPHLLYLLAHFLITHVGEIILIFIGSAIGTTVIIAAYEGIYRANPNPPKMSEADLADYIAQQKKQQDKALTKTILFVFSVVFFFYCLYQASQLSSLD
jgi:beta-lactamase regulating signal transducer with metallopeptidase domain